MNDYNLDNCPVTNGVLTTSYTYGDTDREYVFSCKGRPFAALVSPNLPIPTSTLLDYDLIRKLRIKMTDVQCRKFQFGGHKMRILGRVSSAVQCVQGGRITGSFHIKGLVVTDLYDLLDTHCVAGTKMRERIAQYDKDWAANLASNAADFEDDDMVTPERTSSSSSPVDTMTNSSSSSSVGMMASCSSSPEAKMTSSTVSSMPTPSLAMLTTSSSYEQWVRSHPSYKMTSRISFCSSDLLASSKPSEDRDRVEHHLTLDERLKRTCAKWTTSSSKLHVPDMDTTNDFSITGITYGGIFRTDRWADMWCPNKEGDIVDRSMIDDQPRVVNLNHPDMPDMLRVGDWGSLDDPFKHQVRHMHLAKIRLAHPDRVCHWCGYSLGHKCDLYHPAVTHCSECCLLMKEKNRRSELYAASTRGREGR